MVGSDMPSRSTMSVRVNLRLKEITKSPQKEKRHWNCPGPSAAGSGRPLKPPRGAKRKLKENAHASMLQEQRVLTPEEDAVALDLARARACLHVTLGVQQDALKKQEDSHAQLCSIRAKRDNVAVHVLLFAREAASAAAILRRRASAGSAHDSRRAAREREAAAAAHLAECQMEQELAEAEERIRHLAAQLEEEAQWRAEAEAVFWEYGLVAPEFERHSETLRLQMRPHSPPDPPAPGTPPLFENRAAVPRLPMQQLLSRLSCMHK